VSDCLTLFRPPAVATAPITLGEAA
jgi:hypothetical protein